MHGFIIGNGQNTNTGGEHRWCKALNPQQGEVWWLLERDMGELWVTTAGCASGEGRDLA